MMKFLDVKPGDLVVTSDGMRCAVWTTWSADGGVVGFMNVDELWMVIACISNDETMKIIQDKLVCVLRNGMCGWVRNNWVRRESDMGNWR